MTMQLAMMPAAERHGELVADFSAKRPALGKAQVMGVGRFAAADQASLLRDEADMVAIADAPGLRMERSDLSTDLPRGFRFGSGASVFSSPALASTWSRDFEPCPDGGSPFGMVDGKA